MKNFIVFLNVCMVGAFILSSCNNENNQKPSPKPLTMYDTAILMLHEFVAEGNDTNLGFRNAEEVLKAHIAVDEGIPEMIAGLGKKLRAHGDTTIMKLHNGMERLHRTIFPVYVDSVLHAAITFDSTFPGWRPVLFDNATVLAPYLADLRRPAKPGEGKRSYSFVMMPDLRNEGIIRHDSTGDYILPTQELKRSLGEDYPNPADTEFHPLKQDDFFEGMRRHLQKKQQQKSLTHSKPSQKHQTSYLNEGR